MKTLKLSQEKPYWKLASPIVKPNNCVRYVWFYMQPLLGPLWKDEKQVYKTGFDWQKRQHQTMNESLKFFLRGDSARPILSLTVNDEN